MAAATETIGLLIDVAVKGPQAIPKLAMGFTGLNQAVELARKAMKLMEGAITATIGASLESRAANDKNKKSWDGMTKAASDLGRALGDVVVPVLGALADAFAPILKASAEWLKTNDGIIRSQIVEYMTEFGRVITSSVLTGTLMLAKAWSGLKQTFELAVLAIAKIHSFFGDETAQKVADATAQNIYKEARALQEVEATLDSVAVASGVAFAKFGSAVKQHATPAIRKLDDETKKLLEELDKTFADAAKRSVERRAQENIKSLELEEQKALRTQELAEQTRDLQVTVASEAEDAQRESLEKTIELYEQVGNGIYGSMKSAFSGVIDGTKSVGEAFTQLGNSIIGMIIDMAAEWAIGEAARALASQVASAQIVSAKAGEAAAGAAASQAGIPIIGPALAIAAATAMLAFVLGFAAGGGGGGGGAAPAKAGVSNATTVKHYATGGWVTGGIPGMDSVPAMLMPGEYVMSNREVNQNRSANQSGGSGRGNSVNVTMLTHSRAAFARMYRDEFGPVTKRLSKNRVIRSG